MTDSVSAFVVIGGDDRASGGNLFTDEFGGDVLGNAGAETHAGQALFPFLVADAAEVLAVDVFAKGDVFHLSKDNVLAVGLCSKLDTFEGPAVASSEMELAS